MADRHEHAGHAEAEREAHAGLPPHEHDAEPAAVVFGHVALPPRVDARRLAEAMAVNGISDGDGLPLFDVAEKVAAEYASTGGVGRTEPIREALREALRKALDAAFAHPNHHDWSSYDYARFIEARLRPRDTPHLDRDGDRWSGRPSESGSRRDGRWSAK